MRTTGTTSTSRRSGRRLAAYAATLTLAAGTLLAPSPAVADPSDDDRTLQSAGWLARQLQANDYVLPDFSGEAGSKDFGLTIDALFALVAAGVGGDVVEQVVGRIENDGWEYTQWSDVHDQVDIGSFAKIALALQIGGGDPQNFDISQHAVENDWYNQWPDDTTTIDLVDLVRDSMLPNGHFGIESNHFDQTLAVLTLARTAEGVPAKGVEYLESLQCTDQNSPNYGGLGYGVPGNTCGNVDGDATGFMLSGLLAAGRGPGDASIDLALQWMEANQGADGSFKASWSGAPANSNSTGLVANAARQIGTPSALAIADRARTFLEGLQVDCSSPFNSESDPSAGPGFARTWMGAIAYSQEGYGNAVSGGIFQGQSDQWRRASAQAALGFGELPGFSELSIEGIASEAPGIADCAPASVAVSGLASSSRYGAARTAKVTVTASGGGAANGKVELRRGSTVVSSATLAGGKASIAVPTTLPTGTQTLSFVHVPSSGAASPTRSVTHRVVKARARVSAAWVVRPTRSRAGVLRVSIVSLDGAIRPTAGTVRVVVGSKVINRTLSTSRVDVSVPKLRRGKHRVDVRYGGASNFEAAAGTRTILLVR